MIGIWFRQGKLTGILRIATVLAVMVMFVFCCGRKEGPRELKLSLILGENSDWYRGAVRFGELLEKRSGGRYHIKIFPLAQLAGNQRTELEMVQSGVIDMSMESSILLSLIEPRMSVLSLPWLFENYDIADRVCDGPLGHELLETLPAQGIVGLAYGANGFRQITNSRNAICMPDDIKGMKIRVPGIKMYIDLFKLFDADPSSMNFGELFTALAQGTMDGQENPVSVIFSSRLYDVQKYMTVWNYSYDPVILCINRWLWDSLPVEEQTIFMESAREAMSYERNLVAGGEEALIDSLRGKGMEITWLEHEAVRMFRDTAEPAYRKLSDDVGSDFIGRFMDAVK